MLVINLLLFIFACLILVMSNNYLVSALSKISYFLNLNEFTVGFILVSVATSLPEMFVGVMSALSGTPEFSLGNVIGANIINLTIVIGISAVLAKKLTIESKIVKKDMIFMLIFTLLPVFLFVDHLLWQTLGLFPNMIHGLSKIDGIILLVGFIYYMYNLVKQESKFSKKVEHTSKKEAVKHMVIFLVSITMLLISANYVVKYAEYLSIDLNLSPFLMGIFIISLGTSLPELVFQTKAVLSGHQSMAIGNVVGSVIANSTLVLGVTSFIMPIQANVLVYLTSTMFMLFAAFIFFTLAESDNKITWTEGVAMLFLYILFIVIETFIKTV